MKRLTKVLATQGKALHYSRIDQWDLPVLFSFLIRDRSLFTVLESLANACSLRAETDDDIKQQHASVQEMIQDEVNFFGDAAERILDVRHQLEIAWQDAMPISADNDPRHFMRAIGGWRGGKDYLCKLASTFNDPTASEDDRRMAASTLAKEGENVTWINHDTGQPSFQLTDLMRKLTAALIDPNESTENKRQIATQLQEFFEAVM